MIYCLFWPLTVIDWVPDVKVGLLPQPPLLEPAVPVEVAAVDVDELVAVEATEVAAVAVPGRH
jgi:hypothetical protein